MYIHTTEQAMHNLYDKISFLFLAFAILRWCKSIFTICVLMCLGNILLKLKLHTSKEINVKPKCEKTDTLYSKE